MTRTPRPPIEHTLQTFKTTCPCGTVVLFLGERIVICAACGQPHSRVRCPAVEPRANDYPEDPPIRFEVSGTADFSGGEHGQYGIAHRLVYTCSRCHSWSGNEEQAIRHYDQHMKRLARIA